MEFQNPCEERSEDDEALSFCDLVTEQGVEEFALRDLNTGCLDQEDFGFDFDFGRCDSTTEHVFPADDLFRHGFLFPLALRESVQYSFEKSKSENPLACSNDSLDRQSSFWSNSSSSQTTTDSGEMLRRSNSKSKRNRKPALSWRNDLSLDSQSSFWSISSSLRKKTSSHEISRLSSSKSKGNDKPTPSGGKMSATWRSLTLGLTKNPSMKLEDLRLRQGKTKKNINEAKNLDLRRSVSCNYYKDPKLEEKEAKDVKFEKCSSGKENVVVQKTPWLKGWKMLARFPSMNSCKTSGIAVAENRGLHKAC